ncbi:MAG: ABC transporter ATP-binding protein [Phycisphaerae bacterium]|nr:ABC transporter ATP-binding protein [Phycisphaerae bacterium]
MGSSDIILGGAGIHKSYRTGPVETPVLHGLDLEIRRGEFVLVMGPSGCGKSTLLNIIGLMMSPTRADRLEIDGVDALGLSDAGRTRLRREKIGFVFQRFNLLPVVSAGDNVRLAMRIRGQHPNGRVTDLFDRFGLSGKMDRKPGALSMGEQQRVAIARAVACKPAILLADEPTGNLDSANARHVMDLFGELNRQDGQTIIMITHNEHCAAAADRVTLMKDGRFVDA